MAIVPTGAIYKSLVFDGESSRDYGIYITGQAVYNAPERDVEMINIPGRNGSFALDKGRFQNIEVTYPAGIFADNEADFAQGISDFRNFLCSRNGYVRLTDDYNPDEYRMAVYKSGLDVSPAQLRAGEFQIVFDCKPQRYLTSGEEPITIGEWHETETASGEIASFEAVDGDAVKSLVADINPIQDLNGYDKPWSGGNGKNLFKPSERTVSSSGITYSVDADGKVTLAGTATATTSFTLIPSGSGVTIPETGYYTASLYGATNAKLNGGGNSYTINLAAGAVPSVFAINVTSGTAYNESFYVQFEKGMTATTYEPYSNICPISGYDEVNVYVSPTTSESDATVYTTDLNGTVYGGMLDVVSGVLTVTDVAVDLGSLTWEVWPGYTSIFRCGLPSDCKTVGNQGVPNWLCSAYEVTSGVSVSSTIGSIGQLHASYVLVNNPSYTDASAFTTAMTGQTLVYELATPTTVQLTAEEVELLVGLNQIWANSGDVSVEYGTAPNVLVNPTLFESSPMLEVEGYGSININDDTVTIQNEELGTIKISGGGSGSSMSLDTTQLNNGDTIFYNSAPYAVVKVKAISGDLHITRNGAPTGGSCSISKTSTTATTVFVFPSETTFSKGTNKTVTTSVPLRVSVNDTITNCTLTLTTSYTASTEKVTLSASWTSAPNTIKKTNDYIHNQYYGNSTKSILPSPMYIDLDIGEAYGVIDNEPLSFDNIVTLPAELPKLKSGVNEVTFDNTVTDLKVVPRWWKV